jgi:23S rRNA (cytidine1920-2'-O)/16S rRNA (cytidine1409-2'-O)-methyltransferase
MAKSRARFVALEVLLARHNLHVDEQSIKAGRVIVDGRVITNPAARVRADASVRVQPAARLRGDIKLSYALDRFDVTIAGRVAADVGASAGGFTTALLDRGATRVYAIDVGVGQLVGRLRIEGRVVNLEGHNLGVITRQHVPEPVDVITVDLSYLPLSDAVPQLERLEIAPDADLVALVKPTFELRRGRPPEQRAQLEAALQAAAYAVDAASWRVRARCESAVTGARGTTEFFVHARREVAS